MLVLINILDMQQEVKEDTNIFFTHTFEEHLSPQEFTIPDEKVILHTYL